MSQFTQVHSSKKYRIGTKKKDVAGNEYVYLKGVSSLVAYDAVTFDEAGATTLLAANAIGPVAFAQAAVDSSSKYGWFCIAGSTNANIVASSSDNASIGRETTDGKVGDGRAAGDQIIGAVARTATTTAAVGTVQIWYPSVNDITGS